MKLTNASCALSLAALAIIGGPLAMANDSGFYVGGNVGQSRARIDDGRISSGLASQGGTVTSIDDDDRHLGYKVFGGYRFDRYFAVEGGYFDLGRFGFTATTLPPGTYSGDIKIRGGNFDLVGILPITKRFSVFGRGGVIYADSKDRFAGTGLVNVLDSRRSKSAANYKFGVGLEYDFIKSFGMRIEAERYRIDDAINHHGDVDLFSAGLVVRFGGKDAAPPPVAPVAAPPPVAVVPPPPPPPPPPVARKVTFSADSLFDFDKAIIKPAGTQSLDRFAADLKGASFDVITVTGHTDRIGSHAYNMELSKRRAEAVKNYLMTEAQIPAGKIEARGVDGSDPVTAQGQCKGTKATKALIACLQPDRRVEVEVSGTKY